MLQQVFGWSAGVASIVVCCNFLPRFASVLDAHHLSSVVCEMFWKRAWGGQNYQLVTHGVQCHLKTVFRNAYRMLLVALWSLLTSLAGSRV
ncbi:unnamed protein product [Brassica oleracea var. botrytis]|uniref:Uncharacterized protein n=2 Tax=Brassica TaxID=3705 RepID=A0A3P6EB02_BRAOL|nr:unnamed protein product [Brassica napus]VDD31315.1 unnamed protein product [Brassica oleracea]